MTDVCTASASFLRMLTANLTSGVLSAIYASVNIAKDERLFRTREELSPYSSSVQHYTSAQQRLALCSASYKEGCAALPWKSVNVIISKASKMEALVP